MASQFKLKKIVALLGATLLLSSFSYIAPVSSSADPSSSEEIYQVTFNSTGGDAVDSGTYVDGGAVEEPFAPTRTGYTFMGWSDTDGGSSISFPYYPGVTEDITLFALWTANSYVVTFHPMGGDDVSDLTFETGGSLDAPADPSRAGYFFSGWSATDNGAAITFPYSPGVTEDITLYALWSAGTHIVRFEDGGNVLSTGSFETDGTVDEPTPPTRTGYTFMGWSDTDGGTSITFPYAPDVVEDITLFALWSADSHNVNFESFGEVVSTDSFVTDGVVSEPAPLSRTGYSFMGWSDTDGGSQIYFPYVPGVVNGITLYALWSADSHNVIFESFGNTFGYALFYTDGSVDEPTPPSLTGYTFLGWSATNGGSAVTFPYFPGVAEGITLYALWSVDSYTVTFNSNGGSDVPSDSFITDGSVAEPTPPTRAGYTFLGWSASDGGFLIGFPYSPWVTEDITLYALWSVDSHTVTFNSNGGSYVFSGSFETDGSIFEPTAPTRTGYTFMGWSDTDGGTAVDFPYAPGVIEDITLYALWRVDSHNVNFESNGEVVSADSFDTDGSVNEPAPPTRNGYTFMGWSDTDGGTAVDFPYAPGVIEDITLYALWRVDSHNVNFESNGEVVSADSFDTDGSVNEPAPPTRNGYTFQGWSASDGGSPISFPYFPGVTEGITLYALWIADSHNVTFESFGNPIDSGSFDTDGPVAEPTPPTLTGWTFLGWSDTPGGSAVSFPYYPGITEDITFYALWSADSHTVTFNSNGGSDVSSGSFVTDGSVDAPSDPTRTGYTFVGWSDTDGGTAIDFPYSPGVAEGITLYALWSADSHTVIFNSNGGSDVSSGSFVTDGSVVEPTAPTRTGYTFLGWSATDGGTAVTFPYAPGVIDDITLYALWSVNSHFVYFQSINGEVLYTESFNTDGFVAQPSDPARTGYTFLGWSATDGGTAVTFPYAPGVAEAIALYALWSADSHTVTFNSNGGSAVSSGSFDTDGSVVEPTAPTRTGYTFLGWSATDGGTLIEFPYAPGVAEGITSYALWSINTYVVTYNSNGGTTVTSGSFVYLEEIGSAPRRPIRSGAIFAGWSATDGGSAITFPYAPGVASNITLYAKWTFLAPMLSTSSAASLAPGDALSIRVSRVNEGCTVTVSWVQENTGVSSVSRTARADRTTGVFTIATPGTAGRYTLTTNKIGTDCSNTAEVTISKAFVVGKASSIVAKLTSTSTFISRNPVISVSGKVKSGSVANADREMTVSLRRNGVEVDSDTATTNDSGEFTLTFSAGTYLAGQYSAVITGEADSIYLSAEGIANRLTLRS